MKGSFFLLTQKTYVCRYLLELPQWIHITLFESSELQLELNKDVETAAQKLVAMIPDLTIDEARFVAKANKLEVQWSLQHTPAKQYKGNIHLIKAERSSHIPGATADYGLSEVSCLLELSSFPDWDANIKKSVQSTMFRIIGLRSDIKYLSWETSVVFFFYLFCLFFFGEDGSCKPWCLL